MCVCVSLTGVVHVLRCVCVSLMGVVHVLRCVCVRARVCVCVRVCVYCLQSKAKSVGFYTSTLILTLIPKLNPLSFMCKSDFSCTTQMAACTI